MTVRDGVAQPIYFIKGRLRGNLITVYKYLWREEISDNGGVFNLADKKKK